jgi:hypothetical protein
MPDAPRIFRPRGQQTRKQQQAAYNKGRVRVDPDYKQYNTPRWRQLRAQHLAIHPWCRWCYFLFAKKVRAKIANHIDPVRRREDFYDEANIEGLCTRCHALATACEASGAVPFAGREDFRGRMISAGHPFHDERLPIYQRSARLDRNG